MSKPKFVTITLDGQEAEVLPESVAVYVRNGWTATDDGSSEAPAAEPVQPPAPPARVLPPNPNPERKDQ